MSAIDSGVLEPALKEMFDDPIVKLLMERDGVSKKNLMPLLKEAAVKIRERESEVAA